MTEASCTRCREQVSAVLDGELAHTEHPEVAAHLAACEACRAWRLQAEHLHRRLRVRPADDVPDLTSEILAAFPAARPSRQRRVIRHRRGAVVAAVALAIALPVGAIAVGSTPRPAPALSIDAVATASTGTAGAVYMTIVNDGGPDRLVGAATPEAGESVIHGTSADDGVVVMTVHDRHEIATEATTVLGPGGAHVMLHDLADDLKPGDVIRVRLRFARSPELELEVPVVSAADVPAHLWTPA